MRIPKQRLALACLSACLLLASEFGAASASAADANNGRRIAQARCSPCHIVVPNQRQELAKSPPFEDIARQNGFNAALIASRQSEGWRVDALGAPHIGERTEAKLISDFIGKIGELLPQLIMSFPKIISGHTDDVVQLEWELRRRCQSVGSAV